MRNLPRGVFSDTHARAMFASHDFANAARSNSAAACPIIRQVHAIAISHLFMRYSLLYDLDKIEYAPLQAKKQVKSK